MRLILLGAIILLSSCENKKETIAKRQQAIRKEMEEVNSFFYKAMDSLDKIKKMDTNSTKLLEIAEEVRSTDGKRVVALLKLRKEYDSLQAALK